MTTMIAEVYDALRDAGAGEEKARRAAEALAGHEDRFTRLEHKIDTVDTRLNRRIDEVEASLTRRIDGVEATLTRRIDGVEATLTRRIDGVEATLGGKIDRVEARLRTEQVVIRWLIGTSIAGLLAIILKLYFH